jgi:SM-20-related protein
MEISRSLLDGLMKNGWVQSDELLSSQSRLDWLSLAENYLQLGQFRPAKIAGGLDEKIRSDQIFWLEPHLDEHNQIFHQLENWRLALSRGLMISMPKIEAHLASYSPGHGYTLHCDQPQKSGARVITFVVYLHSHWQAGQGGELSIFEGPQGRNEIQRIEPRPGRVVFFNSGEIWHQVQESKFQRLSLTGWFRHS